MGWHLVTAEKCYEIRRLLLDLLPRLNPHVPVARMKRWAATISKFDELRSDLDDLFFQDFPKATVKEQPYFGREKDKPLRQG